MARKTRKLQKDGTAGSDAVPINQDLLIIILLFLPVKSLLRFKSVSKNWFSIISSPHFINLKSKRFSNDISGLLLRRIYWPGNPNPQYKYIPVDENDALPSSRWNESPMPTVDFVQNDGPLKVQHSCNGLLLCTGNFAGRRTHYVFNPTTKAYLTVPNQVLDSGNVCRVFSMYLAFDPRKSSHYKLVCTYHSHSPMLAGVEYNLAIYSSETGDLRPSKAFIDRLGHDLSGGFYWNGALHWINCERGGMYFNVDEERVGTFPSPPRSEEGTSRYLLYFGESSDHLHLVESDYAVWKTTNFNVYEMEKGYSGWFVKFRVDLQPVFSAFPESIINPGDGTDRFGVLGVIRKNGDGKSFVVLSICHKVIRFNFEDGSFSKLCDLRATDYQVYTWRLSIPFIGSLYPL